MKIRIPNAQMSWAKAIDPWSPDKNEISGSCVSYYYNFKSIS